MIDARSPLFARFLFFFSFISVCAACITCSVIFHVSAAVSSKRAVAARLAPASKNRSVVFLLLNWANEGSAWSSHANTKARWPFCSITLSLWKRRTLVIRKIFCEQKLSLCFVSFANEINAMLFVRKTPLSCWLTLRAACDSWCSSSKICWTSRPGSRASLLFF